MIIVTGAAGQLGRRVFKRLAMIVDPGQIGVSVRDPAQGARLAERGIRVHRAESGDRASLAAAFEGADQVLIVSANKLGEEARRLHRNAIAAVQAAAAGRILYTSHQGAGLGSPFARAGTEGGLATSGVPFTS